MWQCFRISAVVLYSMGFRSPTRRGNLGVSRPLKALWFATSEWQPNCCYWLAGVTLNSPTYEKSVPSVGVFLELLWAILLLFTIITKFISLSVLCMCVRDLKGKGLQLSTPKFQRYSPWQVLCTDPEIKRSKSQVTKHKLCTTLESRPFKNESNISKKHIARRDL